MTAVGGLLVALPGGGAVRADGRSLALPLAGVSGPNSIESALSAEAPIRDGRWSAIVLHHSGDPAATPASLEQQARARGLNGLGYHFVIGNGVNMGAGEVLAGYRWLEQSPGAHVAGPEGEAYNLASVGICLVNDGNRRRYSEEQLARAVQLTRLLMRELDIPADRVFLHRDLAEVSSPGVLFPEARFRQLIMAE